MAQRQLNQKLEGKCFEGRLAPVQQLVEQGAEVTGNCILRACRGNGLTEQRKAVLAFLVEKGGDLHYVGPEGKTAATSAAGFGGAGADMLRHLKSLGVDIFASNRYGRSTLMEACEYQELPCVQYLLDEHAASAGGLEAALQATDKNGFTALHFAMEAVSKRRASVVAELIARGADVHARCTERRTLNMPAGAGSTPLLILCNQSAPNLATLTLLLDSGADPKATDDDGKTALRVMGWQHMQGDTPEVMRVCERLLELGVDPTAACKRSKRTALMGAVRCGRQAFSKALIDAFPADSKSDCVACADDDGKTCVHQAAAGCMDYKVTPALKLALSAARPSTVDAVDAKGQTALQTALGCEVDVERAKRDARRNKIKTGGKWAVVLELVRAGAVVSADAVAQVKAEYPGHKDLLGEVPDLIEACEVAHSNPGEAAAFLAKQEAIRAEQAKAAAAAEEERKRKEAADAAAQRAADVRKARAIAAGGAAAIMAWAYLRYFR